MTVLNSYSPKAGVAGKDFTITLTDLSDRQLSADRPQPVADGPDVYPVGITGVQPGIYFVTVSNAAMETENRITISR